MRCFVSSFDRRAAIPCVPRLFAILSLFVMLAVPLARARAAVPYLGLFIDLDNHFYSAGTSSNALTYQSVSGAWAFVSSTANMSLCQSQSGASLGSSNTLLVYGQARAAMPIVSASYSTYADANGSVAVLRASSIPGDVSCIGAVVAPAQFDHVFSSGFE